MPYLFAITVAAFVALLWAAFSAAQHIRRARRRRKLAWNSPLPEADITNAAAALEPWLEPEAAASTFPAPPPPMPTSEKQPIRFPLSSQRPTRFTENPPPPALAAGPIPVRRPPASVTPDNRTNWPGFSFPNEPGDLSDPVAGPRLNDRNGRHR